MPLETENESEFAHLKLKISQSDLFPEISSCLVCPLFAPFWPGLGLPRPKAIVVIPKNQPLPKHLRKKRVKVRSTPATTLQKKDPLK